MAKSTQPAWAGKLRKQLKRAGEEDRDLSRFGADQHEYQLKPELRMVLIKMLSHFHVPGMEEQIGVLWDFGAYPEAISVICYSGGWAVKEAWWPRVLERMSTLQGEDFQDACGIFFILRDYPEIHAGLLKDQLYRTDLDQNDKSVLFHHLSELNGREEVPDYFLDYLPDERNHERAEYMTLICAIWVTKGVRDPPAGADLGVATGQVPHPPGRQGRLRGQSDADKKPDRPEWRLLYWDQPPLRGDLLQPDELSGPLRLDYRGGWRLLMDDQQWADWKREHGFAS